MVDPHGGDQRPHAPTPSSWPVGFAVGIAILLTGLVVGWTIVLLGAVLTVSFGFLWIRDVTAGLRTAPVEPEPVETAPAPAPMPSRGAADELALPLATEEEIERFPRSKFLEGATLGIGAAIGGLVTLPAVGFAVLPPFTKGKEDEVDVGALDAFPEGEWQVVTFLKDPEEGEVTRRTAYIRNNGELQGQPSFTIVSNRCVHLGCPVQPGGPIEDEAKETERIQVDGRTSVVERTPTKPSGFACPCHGGAYDVEGNRTAGPPVRALDRYDYAIRDGRLILLDTYSVGKVEGTGKEAVLTRYKLAAPGVHVDGPEQLFYPLIPPD